MEKLPIKPGWLIVFALCLLPVLGWALLIPLAFRFTDYTTTVTSLGQVCALVGLTLFSLAIILSGRFRFTEKLFGGMNRVYIAHHLIGGSAFLFLLVHPILMVSAYIPISLRLAANMLIPGRNLPATLGMCALLLLMTLLILTYFVPLRYQLWRFTHKFMGIALLLGSLHGLLMHGNISQSPFLTGYFYVLVGTALLVYVYRTILGRYLVGRYRYVVKSVTNISNQVVRVEMTPIEKPMVYLPGQFMFVTFNHLEYSETHPFSISAAPDESVVAFSAKASGDWTATLSKLPAKTPVKIEGPFGYFTYSRYSNRKQIWIAGGIGITPFYSMAKALLPEYQIDLYYAVNEPQEAVYLKELQDLAKKKPNFKVSPWYGKTQGHITADKIAEAHSPIKNWDIFICGPGPMMTNLKKQFKDLGLKGSQLHTEEFKID